MEGITLDNTLLISRDLSSDIWRESCIYIININGPIIGHCGSHVVNGKSLIYESRIHIPYYRDSYGTSRKYFNELIPL